MSRESVTVNPAAKRIEKDLAKFKADQAAQAMYHIEPENEDDIFQLKGYVYGPPDTPYQGGVFHLKMTVPNDYPFRPPVCKMTTKVWHPNIGEAGSICLDTLSGKWTAAMSIRTAMMSIQALLSTPNSDSGLNGTVTYLMNKDREAYQKTATFWTYHYAVVNKTEQMMADNAPMEAMISQVMAQTGIGYEEALKSLSYNCWKIPETLAAVDRRAKVKVARR